MLLTLDELIKDANSLPLVPLTGTTAYHQSIPVLKKYVDDALSTIQIPVEINLLISAPTAI